MVKVGSVIAKILFVAVVVVVIIVVVNVVVMVLLVVADHIIFICGKCMFT